MKSSSKLKLLSSLLAASLVLSACQDSASKADNENTGVINASSNSDDSSGSDAVNSVNPVVADAPASVEQQMIDILSRYRWTLSTAKDKNSQSITALTSIKDQVIITFNQYQGQDTVSYSVGCNTMNATFQLQADTLITEDSMSTKMSCEDLNTAENRLNELMQGESQLKRVDSEPPILTQITGDAATLVWEGKMTAQAKYNSKGETIFWAVKADSKPCESNNVQLCLQVKPITYDEQGIQTSEGDFAEFNGIIDGYQHDDKHDEVLRLQRFKTDVDTVLVDNVDSEYAYVLDMVIESSVVK